MEVKINREIRDYTEDNQQADTAQEAEEIKPGLPQILTRKVLFFILIQVGGGFTDIHHLQGRSHIILKQ